MVQSSVEEEHKIGDVIQHSVMIRGITVPDFRTLRVPVIINLIFIRPCEIIYNIFALKLYTWFETGGGRVTHKLMWYGYTKTV